MRGQDKILAEVGAVIAQKPFDHWLAVVLEANVPVAPVRTRP
eukprot:COSAG04_NODE_8034_length_1031_cov_2.404506_2_plen_41_part_01